jgi:hypothetical protein
MSVINLDFLNPSQPSFFVHFAYENVSQAMIIETLETLDLGVISDVSFKPTTNKKNERGNSIVVHFERWFRNPTSDQARQKLISGESMRINYTPKAYLQVVAYQPKNKSDTRPLKQPTITFENDYGPKLGPRHTETHREPKVKVKHIESKKEQQYKRPKQQQQQQQQPRYRPSTPEGPPPSPLEPQPVVYASTDVHPDIYDKLQMKPSEKVIVSKGIIMPKRRPPAKKPVTFEDSDSSSDDSESENEILYGDL